jgi:hypothetical protein
MAIESADSMRGAVVQKMAGDTGTKAASGDNTLVAGPTAGTRMALVELMVQNESDVATTIILKDGATGWWRAKLAPGEAIGFAYPPGRERRFGDGAALTLNLSGANPHGWSGRWFVEAVE